MAEEYVSFSSFEEQFDDQLTCGVCLDQYSNPKTLPCLHSFCLKCIELLPVQTKDGKPYINCPTCRVDHWLPQGAADRFPSDFKINCLLDLRQKFASSQRSTPNPSICTKHNDPLKVYCETCDRIICRDCTISTEHNKHTFYLISECYFKHHEQIQGNLDLVKHKLVDINTAMIHLDTREREVLEQGENIKKQINMHAQQLIDSIEQSRTRLTQQVDTTIQQKTQTLATQRQQAQKLHTRLQTCQDMIEHSLKEWNQQQILAQKHTMINEMKTATQHIDPAVFQPMEDANLLFNKNQKEMGSITATAYGKATLELLPCMAKQTSTATLTLCSALDGSPFSLPPSLISSALFFPGSLVKCTITQTHPEKYNITFTPATTKDQLIVQVGGVDIPNSPFTLPVLLPPETKDKPVKIIKGLNVPHGITVCDNGDIVVAERGTHSITVLNEMGVKLKTLHGRPINHPRGVAVSNDGHILVTSKHRLQKLTKNGDQVKSVCNAESGHAQLQFCCPIGIAVNRVTGQIFVADYYNNCIQVFTNDLTFSHTITPSALSPQLNLPHDIAIDNATGYLYISGNDCITKLTENGKYVEKIGSSGSDPGQLSRPTFLTIHNNLVYVSEWGNNRVSVFDTDGKFHYHFGGDGLLNHPRGIAIDTFGNLYVCDTDNKRIVVF